MTKKVAESSMALDVREAFVNRVPVSEAVLVSHQEVFTHVGRAPDHSWHEYDAQGHFHGWTAEGALPTLRTEVHLADCDEPCDGDCADGVGDYEFALTRWRHLCELCGAPVVPGMRENSPVSDRGRQWYTVRVKGGGELVNLGGAQVTFAYPHGFGRGRLDVGEIEYSGGECTVSATVVLGNWWRRRESGGAL